MAIKLAISSQEQVEEAFKTYAKNLDALEGLYSDTGNPLFIWEALAVLNYLRSRRKDGLPVPPLPLIPEWAVSYLYEAATDITKLANGDLKPVPKSPTKQVPHILGLVSGKGTNKFVEYRRMRREIDISARAERLRAEGKSGSETTAEISNELGGRDGSLIGKRRRKGRATQDRIDTRVGIKP